MSIEQGNQSGHMGGILVSWVECLANQTNFLHNQTSTNGSDSQTFYIYVGI